MATTKKKKATPEKVIVIAMDREKPTKNKQRFEERNREEAEHIGILYVNKKLVDEALGEPDSIKVTIEPGD